jgi:cytidylate kinase
MSVIAISRGSLSGATKLAHGLGVKLGCRVTDREQVLEAAERYGIGDRGITPQDVLTRHAAGFWDDHDDARRHYLACFRAALLDLVLEGPLVYHGNMAHALLTGVPFVLRVRVNAPMENRIEAMMADLGLSRYETVKRIEAIDNERKRWAEFLYHEDIMNASQYDLVLNLNRVSLDDGVEMVAAAARKKAFDRTPDAVRRVKDLRLATAAEIMLLSDPDTYGLPSSVSANGETGRVEVALSLVGGDSDVVEKQVRAALKGLEGAGELVVRVKIG